MVAGAAETRTVADWHRSAGHGRRWHTAARHRTGYVSRSRSGERARNADPRIGSNRARFAPLPAAVSRTRPRIRAGAQTRLCARGHARACHLSFGPSPPSSYESLTLLLRGTHRSQERKPRTGRYERELDRGPFVVAGSRGETIPTSAPAPWLRRPRCLPRRARWLLAVFDLPGHRIAGGPSHSRCGTTGARLLRSNIVLAASSVDGCGASVAISS